MSWCDSVGLGEVPLAQLVGLNEEIAALVRTGVPLEPGLVQLARELPGQPGTVATTLGRRMQNGESLEQIVSDDNSRLPKLWRAVVMAGLRSGNLAAALEAMTKTGRRIAEMRRSLVLAAIYPIVILLVAFALLIIVSAQLFPVLLEFYEDLGETPPAALVHFEWVIAITIWIPPLAVLVLAIWWLRSLQQSLPRGGRGSLFGWSTPILRTLSDGRIAAFAEILKLLIKHDVPLPDALELAGDASGDIHLRGAARVASKRLREGETPHDHDTIPRGFPPLMGWILLNGRQQPLLARTLEIVADKHRHRAARSATVVAIYAPVVFTAVFGGVIVLGHALLVLGPVWHIFYALGEMP